MVTMGHRSLPSTNRYEGPFQARRSVEGLHSITLKLLRIWVPGLLSDHHDKQAGRTIVAMTVRHEFCNPTLRPDFPIFLQQLHFEATYGPSQDRQTITNSIGCNFSAFPAQKHLRSSLDKFPASNAKLT